LEKSPHLLLRIKVRGWHGGSSVAQFLLVWGIMGLFLLIFDLLAVNALVSLVLAGFVRTKLLSISASFIITELLFLLWGFFAVADSKDANDILGLPLVMAAFAAPILLLASVGFVMLATRMYQERA